MYSDDIVNFFKKFNVDVETVSIMNGSVVDTYELKLNSNTLISKIKSLEENLTLELGMPIRIVAPIPNKKTIGIEVPTSIRKIIPFEKYIPELLNSKMYLPFILGEDVYGNPIIEDIATFPHLLIAGTTGSGKSNLINSIITSLLIVKEFNAVKFVLIDPKRVELSAYEGLFNLDICGMPEVIKSSSHALRALHCVIKEMEERYKILENEGIKNMMEYARCGSSENPPIVIIIDELADLMLSEESIQIEVALQKIAQLGRAASIHLIVATQRPTVNIITGKIKTNLTTRISLKMAQSVDSKTILNCKGAEKLLGKGDMIFQKTLAVRYHGVLITDEFIAHVITKIKKSYEHLRQKIYIRDESITVEFLMRTYNFTKSQSENLMVTYNTQKERFVSLFKEIYELVNS